MARIHHLSPEQAADLVADYLKMVSPDTASEAVGLIVKAINNHQTGGQHKDRAYIYPWLSV